MAINGDGIRDLFKLTQENAAAIEGLKEIAKAHNERLVRMEGTGMRVQPWLALSVAIAALLASLGCGAIGLIVQIAASYTAH